VPQVPELVGKGTLVLDLPTVADVMLGTVDNWNHSAIRTLNPTLAHLLPNQPIKVVTPLGAPTVMQLMSEALSGASAEFNELVRSILFHLPCVARVLIVFAALRRQVGVGTNLRMPVDELGRNINTSDPTTAINENAYSLGIWIYEQTRQQRKIGMADLINTAGNRVSPTYESLISAIDDFSTNASITNFVLGSGNGSWPMATYHQFILRQSTMVDCSKARGLIDWIYWSQTSATAVDLARKYDGTPTPRFSPLAH
jgi:ABC-type phosphate transport system substrate-binding protein